MHVRQVIPRDAIPSIDDPEFGADHFGDPSEEVIVVDGTPPRAYPVRILDYHEIVNDTVDDQAVAVTWCPLCGSAIVYDRAVDGQTLTFGVSGKLADDDLVMYDRQTESEWKQSLGTAINGPLEEARLTVLPSRMTTVEGFTDEHPEGLILQPPGTPTETASDSDDPAKPEYDSAPYRAYFESDGFGLAAHRDTDARREWERGDFAPKTVVLGLEVDGVSRGYPLPWIQDAGGLVTDSLGSVDVLVVAGAAGIHAYRDPGYEWSHVDGTLVGDDAEWNLETGDASDGRTLDRLPARRLFAFTWQDDHGSDAFWSPSE